VAFFGTPAFAAENIWTGAVGTDWAVGANWSLGGTPNASTDVVIPSAPNNQPSINGDYACNHLTVQSGATLTINSGKTLTVNGDAHISGTQVGDGVITLAGASIGNSVSGTFSNLELNRATGVELTNDVVVDGALTLTNGFFTVGAFRLTLKNAIAGVPDNLSAGSTSSITIAGSGSGINLPSPVTTLNNFTLDNTNGTTLQNDL